MTNALYKIIKNILFLKSKEFPDKEEERKLMQRFSASEVGTLWQGLGSVPQELQGNKFYQQQLEYGRDSVGLEPWLSLKGYIGFSFKMPNRELDLETFSGCFLKLTHTWQFKFLIAHGSIGTEPWRQWVGAALLCVWFFIPGFWCLNTHACCLRKEEVLTPQSPRSLIPKTCLLDVKTTWL